MTRHVLSVGPETTILEAAKLMLRHRISGLPIVRHGVPVQVVHAELAQLSRPLGLAVSLFAGIIALTALGWAVRARLLSRHGMRRGQVWGCGFLSPTVRMQYTASSFAQPLVTQFRAFIRNHEVLRPASGYFPAAAGYASHSADPFLRLLFAPAFRSADRFVTRMRILQHGHVHLYVLYLAATLVALLIWGNP